MDIGKLKRKQNAFDQHDGNKYLSKKCQTMPYFAEMVPKLNINLNFLSEYRQKSLNISKLFIYFNNNFINLFKRLIF